MTFAFFDWTQKAVTVGIRPSLSTAGVTAKTIQPARNRSDPPGPTDSDSHGGAVPSPGARGPPSQLPCLATGRAAVTNGYSRRMFC